MIVDRTLMILLIILLVCTGGIVYGWVSYYIEMKKAEKEFLKEGWKRYGEYMKRAKEARESKEKDKVK